MKPTSRFLLSATAFTALTGSALALPLATDTAPNKEVHKEIHKEMHEDMRKEIQEAMKARWEKADTDKDGSISKTEAQAANMTLLLKNFETIDTNKDGKVSELEAKNWLKSQIDAHGKKHPEQADNDADEHGNTHHGMAFKSPKQRQADMLAKFMKADTDKDGALNRTELKAANMVFLLEDFEGIDTNKDGKLSPDEIKVAAEKHHRQRNEPTEHTK
jgi:Ca2+-binding EF-hand superfamily protein